MSKLTKQHFIPEFFLRNFVCKKYLDQEKYRLWSHRKGAKPVLSSTRKLARKKHIYSTRKKIGDEYQKTHEQLLDKTENIAAPVIAKIISTKDISALDLRERDDFAIFIVLLAERNPVAFSTTDALMRELFLKDWSESMSKTSDQELEEIFNKTKARHETEMANVSFAEMKQSMRQGPKEENLALPFSHGISSMWQAAKECSKFMLMREWQLLSAENAGNNFLLSDNPVIKIRDAPEAQAYDVMQGGWGIKDLEIALPLSPDLCFYATEKVDEKFTLLNTKSVDELNRWSINYAVDEVYSSNFEDNIWAAE